jgi:hypothetical protein
MSNRIVIPANLATSFALHLRFIASPVSALGVCDDLRANADDLRGDT